MKAISGSYALIFFCDRARDVAIGRLGSVRLHPGYYVYVGSAFGPGGVRARTEHHRRISKRPHWHLDYLRPFLLLLEIWYTHDDERREHQWAETLSQLRGSRQLIAGFGASDCDCPTHLLAYGYKPSFTRFRLRMRKRVVRHGSINLETVSEKRAREENQ